MSKKIKIWLMAGIILSLSGFLLVFIGFAAGGKKYIRTADLNRLNGAAKWEDKKPDLILKKTKLESFQTIQADLDSINFSIEPSKDENYYISYQIKSQNNENPVSYSVEDGILNIEEKKKAPKFYFIHIDIDFFMDIFQGEIEDYQEKIVIYVPEQEKFQNCQIGLHDGCITVNGFHCEKSALELGYGDFISENASFLESNITLKDGDLKAKGTDFNNTEIVMSYGNFNGKDSFLRNGQIILKDGDMEIERTDISSVDLKLSYGNLKVRDLVIENSSILLKDGDVNCFNVGFLKENGIKDLYGDVSIQMEKEILETITLQLETKNGDIKIAHGLSGNKEEKGDRQYYERVIEPIEHKINIIASDGDIIIK